MDIEIEKTEPTQKGRPGAVHIRLLGSDGKSKGYIGIAAVMKPVANWDDEEFRVVIQTGDTTLDHPIDIGLKIS